MSKAYRKLHVKAYVLSSKSHFFSPLFNFIQISLFLLGHWDKELLVKSIKDFIVTVMGIPLRCQLQSKLFQNCQQAKQNPTF